MEDRRILIGLATEEMMDALGSSRDKQLCHLSRQKSLERLKKKLAVRLKTV